MLALLTIAAWRIMHFIQSDSLSESLRERFYFRFPPPNWYTVEEEGDAVQLTEDPGRFILHRGKLSREVVATPDDIGDYYYYTVKDSKLGELVSCIWCLSIWIAAFTVFGYYAIVSGTALVDQAVHWLVAASGVVLIEKLVDKL